MAHPTLDSGEGIVNELPQSIRDRIEQHEDGCWLWRGTIHRTGYGIVKLDRRMQTAHRVIYERLIGTVDESLHLDHLCRVRNCVNPAHLEPVTCRENIMRGEGLAARNARATHCIRGHAFSEENTLIHSGGKRRCRECERTNQRLRRRAKRLVSS